MFLLRENRSAANLNPRSRGFSLLELLVVLAIISILTVLLVPAVKGLIGVAARRGAVSVILGSLEQARVVALATGRRVYVVFWKRNPPEADAAVILRELDDGALIEPISGWTYFPREIGFCDLENTGNIFKEELPPQLFSLPCLETSRGGRFGMIAFTPEGTIWHPVSSNNSFLFLTDNRREPTTKANANAQTECIALSRFTGRAVLRRGDGGVGRGERE